MAQPIDEHVKAVLELRREVYSWFKDKSIADKAWLHIARQARLSINGLRQHANRQWAQAHRS